MNNVLIQRVDNICFRNKDTGQVELNIEGPFFDTPKLLNNDCGDIGGWSIPLEEKQEEFIKNAVPIPGYFEVEDGTGQLNFVEIEELEKVYYEELEKIYEKRRSMLTGDQMGFFKDELKENGRKVEELEKAIEKIKKLMMIEKFGREEL